jgi:LacI family transcriptional regulator
LRPDAVITVLDNAYESRVESWRDCTVISAGQDLTRFGLPSVVPDDFEAGRQAAQHLRERGLRALAAFGYWDATELKNNGWAVRRADGFIQAAQQEAITVLRYGDRIDPTTGAPEAHQFHAIRKWIVDLPKPVGVFAACDDWAFLLSNYARSFGFRVPEDIALIGVDDEWNACELSDPPLSSVAIPWELIGRATAQLLADTMKRPFRARRSGRIVNVQPTGVTARRSSDVLAVPDPDVAAALAFILAHAHRPLTISKILRQVPTTQRNLERQFKKHVGRRMADEIRRVRVEQAKRFLSGSDLPMPLIAHKCGFGGPTQFGIAFRRETGMTPSKYRRRYRLES